MIGALVVVVVVVDADDDNVGCGGHDGLRR